MRQDDEIKELMEDYDLDEETAERVKELMDELDLDEDDAVELVDEL
jgi:hypothetical protein